MVFVASKERSRLTQGSPPGDLCLRVVGTARDGQVVRLTAAKCAIGSGEGCTLRLRARGVRPVHCLVLRGTHGTVARSWAPNTQINGEPFRDAVLEAGDRLTIGPVEFEVLESEGPPAGPTDAGRTVVLDRRPADRSLHATRTLVAKPKRLKRWRSHVRKLVGEVRKLRTQIDAFQESTLTAPPAGGADADEIQEKLEGYRQQNQQWEATLQGLQGELDSRERQLASELADLESARQSLESERREWQLATEARHDEWTDRERVYREATDALAAAQTAFAAERDLHEANVQSAKQQLAEREAALQSLVSQQSEAAGQLDSLQRRSEELDARAHTLEQREAELAEAQAASRRATEELDACRASFEAQQFATQQQFDEQRAALTTQEQSQREASSALEQRQRELEAAQTELAQRKSNLEQAEASLAHDRNVLLEGEQARAAELQQSAEELQRRASELAARESELAEQRAQLTDRESQLTEREARLAEHDARASETPTDHSQEGFQTIVAERYGFDASELDSRRAELELAEAATRAAADELAAAKAQFEIQQAEALAASGRQAQELAATSDELTQRRNAVAEAEAQLRSERDALFNERLSQEAELRLATEELQRQRADLEQRAAEVETQANVEPEVAVPAIDSALASELAAKETRLAELQAEIERERAALLTEREEFDHASARKSARLDSDADDLKRACEALEAERDELAAEREAFEEQRRRGIDRSETEEPRQSFAPREDEEDDEENEQSLNEFSRSQPPLRRQVSLDTVRAEAGDTARAQPHRDEDVSIEDYMAALLNRTRSGQSVPVIQPAEPTRRNKRKSDVQPVAETEHVEENKDSAAEVPVLDIPATLVQLERRKQVEVRPDMNVLREIGITHARSAIATHSQQRSLHQAYGTLGTSLVCFLAAILVFYFSTHTAFHLTGMAIIVIGIYWLGTSIWAVNQVLTSMKQRRGGLRATLAEIDAEIEALRKEAEAELEEAK